MGMQADQAPASVAWPGTTSHFGPAAPRSSRHPQIFHVVCVIHFVQKVHPTMQGQTWHARQNKCETRTLSHAAGPNMAGKSTILRSTAAVTLLSLCGLMVPAASARVPGIDGIELRTFHGDAPAEGKSAWAMEMHEMQCVPAAEPGVTGLRKQLRTSETYRQDTRCVQFDDERCNL